MKPITPKLFIQSVQTQFKYNSNRQQWLLNSLVTREPSILLLQKLKDLTWKFDIHLQKTRGIQIQNHLPCRGQRTRNNNKTAKRLNRGS